MYQDVALTAYDEAEEMDHLLFLMKMGLSPKIVFSEEIAYVTDHHLVQGMAGRLICIRELGEDFILFVDLSEYADQNREMVCQPKDDRLLEGVLALEIASGANVPFELAGFEVEGEGIHIKHPFLDETGRFPVNPVEHYGDPFVQAFQSSRRVFKVKG